LATKGCVLCLDN